MTLAKLWSTRPDIQQKLDLTKGERDGVQRALEQPYQHQRHEINIAKVEERLCIA